MHPGIDGVASHFLCPSILRIGQQSQKNPRSSHSAGFFLVLIIADQSSGKPPESDHAHSQHQQSHNGHAPLAEGWDTFEEQRIGDGALFAATRFYFYPG